MNYVKSVTMDVQCTMLVIWMVKPGDVKCTLLDRNWLIGNIFCFRFFASEPKTAGSDESPDRKIEQSQSSSSGCEDIKSCLNKSSFDSNR